MKTADGYLRVSRVGKRKDKGASFISPAEQRAAIESWAKANKTTIVDWHEDLDQSGGTLNRPGVNAALKRCRSGLNLLSPWVDWIRVGLSGPLWRRVGLQPF